MSDAAPTLARLAEVRRGPAIESVHHGVVAVADASGAILHAWGDPALTTFPRSSLKPFQALALVESGGADALTTEHLALACASHRAEPFQVAMVSDWLRRMELPESALVCGPAWPMGEADHVAAIRAGDRRRVFHNCSGKHCGFLAASRALGAPTAGYDSPDHPAQRHWLAAFSDFLGHDAAALPRGTDGCGLPALNLSVGDMARAAARFAAGAVPGARRAATARRILGAIAEFPDHLSGRDAATSRVVRAMEGRVPLKQGAEGFVVAFVPERGLGIAIKMADGASRGKMAVLATLLGRLGLLAEDRVAALVEAVEDPILDSNGQRAGQVVPTLN
ncbi:asparaginase [Muricoccus radiodurans]|uniref:asparaginase n=1 Tax=Muricoccus radiodurans TaxID=2231721 RepID=UPI003CEFBDB4